jgi:hypothetical protein
MENVQVQETETLNKRASTVLSSKDLEKQVKKVTEEKEKMQKVTIPWGLP